MKILLVAVNAKYIHSNLAVHSLRAYAGRGLGILTAEGRNTLSEPEGGVEITVQEYTINHRIEDILEGIYRAKPDVLCFSCYIWNIRYVEELAEEYHKLCTKAPIWAGGPEVSYETEAFLQGHDAFAGVMIGEGEQTFLELCRYYAQEGFGQKKCENSQTGDLSDADGRDMDRDHVERLRNIAGLAYRKGEEICFTAARGAVDMSSIPFCYGGTEDFKNRIIYYESSRGCPFRCSYCLSSVDRQLRFRDIELVKKELAFFIEKEVPQVKFVDRTFNCNHDHAMAVWSFIKEHDNGITNFHFEISADLLTGEEITLLRGMRSGLMQLEIGVQSTNSATITEIHRTMRLARLKEVVEEIQSGENIHEHLDLIAGLPFEDYETFAKSFDEIYALKPNQLQLGFLKVLKGSYMYEHAAEYGLVCRAKPPYEVLATKWLAFSDILNIRQVEEMLEVYYNSGQYEMTMKVLETQYESPFSMFRRMGEFYAEKRYFSMSHSRVRRAEILLEFAEAEFGKDRWAAAESIAAESVLPIERERTDVVDVLKESLIFDLYYRENIKSRPSWAADMTEWKEQAKRYAANGKQSHVERFFYRFPAKEVRTIFDLPEREKEPLYVRFDYTRRDPLDHQAFYEYL